MVLESLRENFGKFFFYNEFNSFSGLRIKPRCLRIYVEIIYKEFFRPF